MWIPIIIIAVILFAAIGAAKNEEKKEKEKQEKRQAWSEKLKAQAQAQAETTSTTNSSPRFSLYEDRIEEVHGVECVVINFAVKGLYYRSKKAQNEARLLSVGDFLTMKPEPSNPMDPNAVKVYIDGGSHIGYVDADRAPFVKENLPKLEKLVVSRISNDDIPYIYAEASFRKN